MLDCLTALAFTLMFLHPSLDLILLYLALIGLEVIRGRVSFVELPDDVGNFLDHDGVHCCLGNLLAVGDNPDFAVHGFLEL